MFFFFGHEACGTLVPQPGIKPTSSALEGEFFFFLIFFTIYIFISYIFLLYEHYMLYFYFTYI